MMNMNTKKTEAVHKLVELLMAKLGITESIEDIVKAYQTKDSSLHHISAGLAVAAMLLDDSDNQVENASFPESARKVYYPWKDVLASMYLRPERVNILKTTCSDCGKRMFRLYFSSPGWTWRHLCGRAGTMTICISCPKQESFILEIMN